MIPALIKRILPNIVKHPLLTYSRWSWEVRGLPSQTSGDIAIFKEVLSNRADGKVRVFEWGAGSSTIYYPKFLKALGIDFEWYAMENSERWHQRCQEKIRRAHLDDQVRISYAEFPPFWDLPGYSPGNFVPPTSYPSSDRVDEYVNMPKQAEGLFDVIIIDGRFRRRCLLVAREVIAPNGVVILHDADRVHYHSSLEVYPHVRSVTTGVLPGSRQESVMTLCSLDDVPMTRGGQEGSNGQ